jgi:hypothetical protein
MYVVASMPVRHSSTLFVKSNSWLWTGSFQGTLVTVACDAGATSITVALNPELRFEKGWGELAVPAGPVVEYTTDGQSVPSDPANTTLFTASGGATLIASKEPGHTDVRYGTQLYSVLCLQP